jgi:NAD(P)-dependent dehydrogenase (short-subunit alcohol dehydrogenase family)
MSPAKSTARARVALVTGANRGLGLEASRQLLRLGYRVVMTGRSQQQAEKARRSLDAADDRLIALVLDVGAPGTMQQAFHDATKHMGAIDVIVNNAAVLLHESSDVLSIPADGFRETFDTNVFGVIDVCRVFVPAMAQRGYGRVVNVSSGAGQLSRMSTYAPAYSMSKAALNAFTKILAETYRGTGVLVNAVDPGWVRIDMGGRNAPRSLEQGADTIVWAATLPDDGPTGGFFRDRRRIEW